MYLVPKTMGLTYLCDEPCQVILIAKVQPYQYPRMNDRYQELIRNLDILKDMWKAGKVCAF